MTDQYLLLKFVHILIAILALGASAVLGVALEFHGSHPSHGPFLLRAIRLSSRALFSPDMCSSSGPVCCW